MTLDVLSSIKGAEASEAVENLFEIIKKANPSANSEESLTQSEVTLDGLRSDEVNPVSEEQRNFIVANFPKNKNNYLVVSKVIED